MDLSCEFRPKVVAEALRTVRKPAAARQLQSFFDRCDALGIDEEWLDWAIDRYQAMAASSAYEYLPDHHSFLLAWLLAGERGNRGLACWDFEIQLRMSLLGAVPTSDLPLVTAWTLGRTMPLPVWGNRVPAIPAVLPEDPDLRLAFEGLVEHAVFLAQQATESGESGELSHTAVIWRIGGLFDFVDSGGGELQDRVNGLVRALCDRNLLGGTERNVCTTAANGFGSDRNILTHIRQDPTRITPRSFREAAQAHLSIQSLVERLQLATILVFDWVGEQLQAADPPERAFEAVERELEADWLDFWASNPATGASGADCADEE